MPQIFPSPRTGENKISSNACEIVQLFLPRRHQAVLKALNTSNETVLAIGANLSVSADSHLVAIQQEDGSYQTQAINIQHQVSHLSVSLSLSL